MSYSGVTVIGYKLEIIVMTYSEVTVMSYSGVLVMSYELLRITQKHKNT
jgi:hypothetical protein